MNKLSILTLLSLIALGFCYEYDYIVNLSDKQFDNVFCEVKIRVNRLINYSWTVDLRPSSNVTLSYEVPYPIESIKKYEFKINVGSSKPYELIYLKNIQVIPKYIDDPIKREQKSFHICPPTNDHEVRNTDEFLELKKCN